jgi:hypothetical protein
MTESADTELAETTVPNESQSTLWPISLGGYQVDIAMFLRAVGIGWFMLFGWISNGVVGVSIGLVIAITAVMARPVIVVAVAHAGLLILLPDLTTLTAIIELGLFELGLLVLLLSEYLLDIPVVLLTAGFGLVFITSTVAVLVWAGQLAASFSLVFLIAALSYGIHRYERVSLGLVTDETDTTDHGASQFK